MQTFKTNVHGAINILDLAKPTAAPIALSALVEVNLGTSFRHRSILLIPLVFLYVRITQRADEMRGNGFYLNRKLMWLGPGSNRRPNDFQSFARTN